MKRLLQKPLKHGAGDRSRGQTLVLFAILLPLLLLFLAFVVDAAKAFVDQRHLQNSADAASLAAAQQLVGGSADCTSVLDCTTRYVGLNSGPSGMQECVDASGTPIQSSIDSDPPASRTCYQWPYYDSSGNPHNDQVLVWLYQCADTWFGSFIGIPQLCESVRSVSRANRSPLTGTVTIPGTTIPPSTITNVFTSTTVQNGSTITTPVTSVSTVPGSTVVGTSTVFSTSTSSSTSVSTSVSGGVPRAIFAKNPVCGPNNGIVIDSNPNSSIDAVESNGSVNAPGSNKGTIQAAYLPTTTGGCLSDSSAPGPPTNGYLNTYTLAAQDWPVIFDRPTVCTGHDNTSGTVLKLSNPANGIYCSTTAIEITKMTAQDPQLTLVAPVITIDSTVNNFTIHAFYHSPAGYGLSIWQGNNNGQDLPAGPTFVFNNNKAGVNDVMWIQNGNLDYSGNSGVTGFYEAQNVHIGGLNGNSYIMNGAGPPIGQTTTMSTSTSFATTSTPVSTVTNTSVGSSTVTNVSTNTSTVPPTTNYNTSTSQVTIPGTTQTDSTQTVTTGTTTTLKINE